jgi:hypothetical protein
VVVRSFVASLPRVLRRAPRLTRLLAAAALLAMVAGPLAAPSARWTWPELAVAAGFHRDAWLALRSAKRHSLLDEGSGSDQGRDPWGRRWRLGFRGGTDWPAGPADVAGCVPLTKIYSVGPDGVDQLGGGDDVLVPARVDHSDYPLIAFAPGTNLLEDGWLHAPRRLIGPRFDSPRALDALLVAKPLLWGVAALCAGLAVLWWFAVSPRSRRAWVEVARTLVLTACLAVLGLTGFAAVTWSWVPLSTWVELHSASASLIGFRLAFALSLLVASVTGAVVLRQRAPAPPEDGERPKPAWAARLAAGSLAVGVVSGALSVGLARDEPSRLGRSRSAWIADLGGSESEQLLALAVLPEFDAQAAPAQDAVIKLLRRSERRGAGFTYATLGSYALAAMGEAAVPRLRADVRDRPTLMADTYAMAALSLMGPVAAPAVDDLLPILLSDQHRDWIRHDQVIRVLGAIGPAAAVATDAVILRSGPEAPSAQRCTAARALGRIGGVGADAQLARLLDELLDREDDDVPAELTEAVLRAAIDLGPRGAALRERVPKLLARVLRDDWGFHPELGVSAALHLTRGDFDPALLEPGLAHERSEVRAAARWLLEARERYATR